VIHAAPAGLDYDTIEPLSRQSVQVEYPWNALPRRSRRNAFPL